ncbi:hypothetical protein ASPZODRAFT_71772 [Penicilliopsis zonata CBS 506.65]|uniref:UEV domain-containing protein n=1 Tax=Penicilliopsis zonata CBS 506.65 TaxID=1073090 RepID=A0A1L9SB90_9EURO|nr:hypothetical protein ASPZODRAFT_71772 [Penicilliopsis zonata CBS 506.65]OJJ44421.1 hypothetical protein ASPZODRAFT_71772 [Penicilliopsis zonata CBS 506.65]
MATVPQRTLNWLYSVLTKDHHDPKQTYLDPNRTYYDVARALTQYPTLSPRTDVYTYENGYSALLLHIVGTLPVSFRGTVYNFPIALWVPNSYPREPPIVYVTPTQDMAVRIGQHVTLEGRVYHHYLAHWAEAWDKSSLVDFLSILREVFAKEPPVRYKQQQQQQQQPRQPEPVQTPPPVPPLPAELASSSSPTPAPQGTTPTPPRPPKPGQAVASPAEGRYNSPPPLPPLPPKDQDARRLSYQPQANLNTFSQHVSQHVPERPSNLGRAVHAYPSQQPHQQAAPAPALAPPYRQGPTNTFPVQSNASGVRVSPQAPRYGTQFTSSPSPTQRFPNQYPPQQPTQQQQQQLPPHYPHQTQPVQPAPPPSKVETPDLLTSPFELELPSFAPSGPVPPIPPNPQKDALLHAVARTVTETLQSNVAQSKCAAQSLTSQSQSLLAAIATLQGEMAALQSFHSTLQSNTSILQQFIRRADGVIAEAQARISSPAPPPSSAASAPDGPSSSTGLPPIDDLLVAPTVVGKQLYDLVAEERGIEQAIYALQAALVRGIIGVETWSRHTRGLAREAFLRRALIRKIGKGMGLE